MQRWEYLTLDWDWGDDQQRRAFGVNQVKIEDWKKDPLLEEYLSKLGEEGWELVAVDEGLYIFKRPKP